MLPRPAALLALLVFSACFPQELGEGEGEGEGEDEGEPCLENHIPLRRGTDDANGFGTTVLVERGGEQGLLVVDTGSALTFLYLGQNADPPFLPHAGRIDIGCEQIDVAGRDFDGSTSITGLPIIGVLGADFFHSRTSVLDLKEDEIVRFADDSDGPAFDGDESALPYENVLDHMLVRVTVDGIALRLMFDTGSPDLLWIGVDGEPGDVESGAQDVEGNIFPIFIGTADLEMAGEGAREVRVLRAPEFPYFAETVAILGGDIQGLLGLSSVEGRRLVFLPDEDTILISRP